MPLLYIIVNLLSTERGLLIDTEQQQQQLIITCKRKASYSILKAIIMRSDLLSKRLFIAGSFGLPWLWIVHVLYAVKGSPENDEGLLNPDDRE